MNPRPDRCLCVALFVCVVAGCSRGSGTAPSGAVTKPAAVRPVRRVPATVGGPTAAPETVTFRATVRSVDIIHDARGPITLVDFDPSFVLSVRVHCATPPTGPIRPGNDITLGIHSPTLLFGTREVIGETFDFTITRSSSPRGLRLHGLRLAEDEQTRAIFEIP